MTELETTLITSIQKALPGAVVQIENPDDMHFSATITSALFQGKTRMQQHRMVYAALGNAFENDLHALQLTTRTPA